MQKQTILEYIPTTCKVLEESKDAKGEPVLRVLVKFQEANRINGNKRRYSKELLEREIRRLLPLMQEGSVWGCAYHPEDGIGKVGDITHSWDKVWMEPNGECFGEISVIPTSQGKDLQVVLKRGKVGMSSRGRGTLTHAKETIAGKEEEFDDVNSDYSMLSPGDFVLGPSVDDAGPVRVLESKLNEGPDSNETSNKGVTELEIKNVEELKKAYPEFVKTIEETIRKAVEAELDAKIAAAVAEQKDALKEEAENVVLEVAAQRESQIIEQVREAVVALTEIDGVIPDENEEEEEEEEEEQIVTKTKKVEQVQPDSEKDTLKAKVKELEDKVKADGEKATAEAAQKGLKDSLDKLLKDAKYVKYGKIISESIVKDGRVEAKDEVDLKAKVETELAKAQKTIAEAKKAGIIAGGLDEKGIIANPEGDDKLDEAQKKEKDQALEKEARAAGFKGDVKTLKG